MKWRIKSSTAVIIMEKANPTGYLWLLLALWAFLAPIEPLLWIPEQTEFWCAESWSKIQVRAMNVKRKGRTRYTHFLKDFTREWIKEPSSCMPNYQRNLSWKAKIGFRVLNCNSFYSLKENVHVLKWEVYMMSYFFEWVLEAMNSNNLDATGPKFIKEQEDWHQNHQGQQGDCEHINYNCCITQIPVFCPTAHIE